MSKKVFVLVHDYWHHDDSIKPMMDYRECDTFSVK